MSKAFSNRNIPRILVAGLLLALLAAFVFRSVAYQEFSVPGNSMSPVVHDGDYIRVNKYAYLISAPKRGDLIVFWHPGLKTHYLKRVIGLPGDNVQMQGGAPVINGVVAQRREIAPYQMSLGRSDGEKAAAQKPVTQFEETLPDGVRYHTLDLFRGMRDNTDPFSVPPGAYFVLGDNRDDSNDSRFAAFGFVPESMIVGRAVTRYWDGAARREVSEGIE